MAYGNISGKGNFGSRMSRKQFGQALGLGAAGVAAAGLGLGGVAHAVPPNDPNIVDGNTGQPAIGGETLIWVYPTAIESNDVPNVQWALDYIHPGGTVILKQYQAGTSNPLYFNFGTTGTVSITKSVTLQGEFTGPRKPLAGVGYGGWILEGTTILGGTAPVRIPRLGEPVGPSFLIKDIIFDSPTNRAIGCGTSSGYNEISGCQMLNVINGPLPGSPTGAFWMIIHGGTDAAGINGLNGTLKIKNNFFGKPASMASSVNNLMHVSNCNLQVEISGNEVEDCVWAGILVMLNMGYSVIIRNKVNKTGSFRDTAPFYFTGMGIGVGVYPPNSNFLTHYSYEGGAEVSHNDVTIASHNSAGIVIADYPPDQFPTLPGPYIYPPAPATYMVSNNIVQMHPNDINNTFNPSAIYFGGSASNVTCTNNVVEGEAQYGFRLSRSMGAPAASGNASSFVMNNIFSGNDLSGFDASIAQVDLDEYSQYNYFGPLDYLPGNRYGMLVGENAKAGIYCQGNNNHFEGEQFMSADPYYPGWTVTSKDPLTGQIVTYDGLGYVLFDTDSFNNKIVALKGPTAPYGKDLCGQVLDLTGNNKVPGYKKCEPY